MTHILNRPLEESGDMGAASDEARATAVEPVPVSPLRDGIPSAWSFLGAEKITLDRRALVYALGRFGDVYGPLPVDLFHPDAWSGDMPNALHDLIAVALCEADWRSVIPLDAQAMSAGTDETAQQAQGQSPASAVPQGMRPDSGPNIEGRSK